MLEITEAIFKILHWLSIYSKPSFRCRKECIQYASSLAKIELFMHKHISSEELIELYNFKRFSLTISFSFMPTQLQAMKLQITTWNHLLKKFHESGASFFNLRNSYPFSIQDLDSRAPNSCLWDFLIQIRVRDKYGSGIQEAKKALDLEQQKVIS